MILTHQDCGARAVLVEKHTPGGLRAVVECSDCGVVAVEGYVADGGMTAGESDGSAPLQPGEYVRAGGDLVVRPPRGPHLLLHGFTEERKKGQRKGTGPVTLVEPVDNGDWKGWLRDGVWIEEER